MLTLEIREYQHRVRRRLVVAFGVIAAITLAVTLFLPDRPLASAALGIVAAGILMATTAYTMDGMVLADGIAVGFVAVDYLVKVVVVVGSLLLARYVSFFSPPAVAVALVLAIVATAVVQVSAVKVKQRIESEESR